MATYIYPDDASMNDRKPDRGYSIARAPNNTSFSSVLGYEKRKRLSRKVLRKFTFSYTNISEARKIGGFANLATLVKQEKQSNPNTILIDAGDYFSGPYISTLTEGEAVIKSMNYLGIDAACIGNHEFDHGWDNMLEQIKEAEFPILNGNIFYEGTDKLVWDNPYIILEREGLRIGIIGLHGKFAFYDTTNVKMTEGIEARDEEKYLRQYIEELEPITDLIILSVHQGMPARQSTIGLTDVERNLYKDILLAQNVPGIDVIVTGHAHQGTDRALVSNGTIIVSRAATHKN